MITIQDQAVNTLTYLNYRKHYVNKTNKCTYTS
jgi:hypothetical protein